MLPWDCLFAPKRKKLSRFALKRHNGGRVLVFVMGAFAEVSGGREPHLRHHPPPTTRR